MATMLTLADIQIRDPFLYTDRERHEYLLFGSTDTDVWHGEGVGFDCYRSSDLETWQGPIPAFRPPRGFWATRNFWAPEVHAYRNQFFLFATFAGDGHPRGTQILVADRPEGPYHEHSVGPVTPHAWECLDGTLHVDSAGHPWIVFCHEWLQVVDGEIHAQRLSEDLRRAIGPPQRLFSASEAGWVRPTTHEWMSGCRQGFVTDGPFLHRMRSGALTMLWSSFGEEGYAMGTATSSSGTVLGPWKHESVPLWSRDGGHGMVARTFDDELVLVLHQPNETPHERAIFLPIHEREGTLQIGPSSEPGRRSR